MYAIFIWSQCRILTTGYNKYDYQDRIIAEEITPWNIGVTHHIFVPHPYFNDPFLIMVVPVIFIKYIPFANNNNKNSHIKIWIVYGNMITSTHTCDLDL